MSENIYYEDVKLIKKPRKKRIKHFFIFLLGVLIFAGCFMAAKVLSTAFTVGNISAYVVYGDTLLKINKSTMFAVTLGEFSDIREAEKVSLSASIQGASGYVWDEGGYFVIGNVYPSHDDALRVVENLKGTNYNVGVKEIVFPRLALDFSIYDNDDMYIIKQSIESFDMVYDELYSSSNKLDKRETTHLAVSSRLSELRGNIKSYIVAVQNLLNKSPSKLTRIQSSLIKVDEILDQTIIRTIDSGIANYSLKNAIVSVVRIKYELFNELA